MKLSVSVWLDICSGLMTTRSLRDITIDNRITDPRALSVLCSIDFPKPHFLPLTLRIDEFKGSSGVYDPENKRWDISRFHCNLSDGFLGCVMNIPPCVSLAYLISYFQKYSLNQRRRIQFFCCDTRSGFLSLDRHCFPNARVCVDMFHVVRPLNDNVSDVRRSLQKYLRARGDETSYQLLKRSARLLTTSSFHRGDYWGDSSTKKTELLEI